MAEGWQGQRAGTACICTTSPLKSQTRSCCCSASPGLSLQSRIPVAATPWGEEGMVTGRAGQALGIQSRPFESLSFPLIKGSDSNPGGHPRGQLHPLTQFRPQQRPRAQMATVAAAGSLSCQGAEMDLRPRPVLTVYPPSHLISLREARHMRPWAQRLGSVSHSCCLSVSLPPECQGGRTAGLLVPAPSRWL